MRSAGGFRVLRWFGVLVLLAVVGSIGALGALATTATVSRTAPTCKPAQKSTRAKSCIPVCKTGQTPTKAKPCAKKPKPHAITITYPLTVPTRPPAATGGTTPAATTTQPAAVGNTPLPLAGDNCPDGTVIPESANAGDEDNDNESGFPSDGDGCL
jgi:hypothetical protein